MPTERITLSRVLRLPGSASRLASVTAMWSRLFLLRLANVRDDHLYLVGGQPFVPECVHCLLVLPAIGDHVAEIGVRSVLGIVGDEAGYFCGRFSGEIGAMACGAFCFINRRSVIRGPG